MSLQYDTFRAQRYLRSRFRQDAFFLASDADDLELEMIDLSRKTIHSTLGNSVAINESLGMELLTSNSISLIPGEAWENGLPFILKSQGDEEWTAGLVPPGVTVSNTSSTTSGLLINFTLGTTPTNLYRLVIGAQEQVVTAPLDTQSSIHDPFLQNVNLNETTEQKVRLVYTVNLVLDSNQTNTPVPYTGQNVAYNLANLVNYIQVTSTGGTSDGTVSSQGSLASKSEVDGSSYTITVWNSTNTFPTGNSDLANFSNGTFIDSLGNSYHINSLQTTTIVNPNDGIIITLDQEIGNPTSTPYQKVPTITTSIPYYLYKQDVYYTTIDTGIPTGSLFYTSGKINFNTTYGIVHPSDLIDLRTVIQNSSVFQNDTNQKENIRVTGGGTLTLASPFLTWSSAFTLINPSGSNQTIAPNTVMIENGGSVVYYLNLSGGTIGLGNQTVTVSSFGSTSTLSGSPNLSSVSLGNSVTGSDGNNTYITAVDNVNKTITTASALTADGSTIIYLDTFAPGYGPDGIMSFVLAVREGSTIYVPNSASVTTVGTYASQTENANGAVISGSSIYFQPAEASDPGMITLNASNNDVLMQSGTGAVSAAPGITYQGTQGLLASLDSSGTLGTEFGQGVGSFSNFDLILENKDNGGIAFYTNNTPVGGWLNNGGLLISPSTTGPILTGSSTSPYALTVSNNNASSQTFQIAAATGSGGGVRFNMLGGSSSSNYSWQLFTNGNSLDLTPSTAIGGSTFTTPALSIDHSGNTALTGQLTLSSNSAPILTTDGTNLIIHNGGLQVNSGGPVLSDSGGNLNINTPIQIQSGSILSNYSANTISVNYTSGANLPIVTSAAPSTNGLQIVRGTFTIDIDTSSNISSITKQCGEGFTFSASGSTITLTYNETFLNENNYTTIIPSTGDSGCQIGGTSTAIGGSMDLTNNRGLDISNLQVSFIIIGQRYTGY